MSDPVKSYELKITGSQPIILETLDSSSTAGSEDALEAGKISEESIKTFEDLLKLCGEAGWWQLKVFLLASFCGFLTALHNLAYAFIGAAPDHWCTLPLVHDSSGELIDKSLIKNWTIPLKNKDKLIYEECRGYQLPDGNGPWTPIELSNLSLYNTTQTCTSIEFDNSIFNSTIVTEFDLVCGSTGWASVVQSIYMIGILVGSPVFGTLSDKIGRQKTIWIASAIFIVSGPMVAFAPNFPILMIARFILGFSSPGIYATSFVLAVESVGMEWRGVVGNLFCLPFAFGFMALPGFAYFFRDWRNLQLVLSAPSIFQIFVCWLSSESPRWLLRKGQGIEAKRILLEAASINGRITKLPHNFEDLVLKVAQLEKDTPPPQMSWKGKVRYSLMGHLTLFQTPKLRMQTLVLYACWLSISMVYYGISLNSTNLSTDKYLYTFLNGVLEIPSYFMVPPLIKYMGRRKVFTGFLLLCGISLLSSLFFGPGSISIVTLALVGKLLIGAAYALIYLYATEIIPTLLRTFGVGSASMIGRIGSASAPFIVDLLGREEKTIPTIVFGIVSILAACISLLLPETRNRPLPETVADVENYKN